MGLSNLRFLDCSGTDIDDQLVQCLQLSHPKLKQICVFGKKKYAYSVYFLKFECMSIF